MTITEQTAIAYVKEQMSSETAVVIRSSEMRHMDGFGPFCSVYGSYEVDNGTQTLPFHWEVWIDEGKIYGEW